MKPPIVAIDIGNSRIKLGYFSVTEPATGAPLPDSAIAVPLDRFDETALLAWLGQLPAGYETRVASVNRTAAEKLLGLLRRNEAAGSAGHGMSAVRLLCNDDLPIETSLPSRQQIGIDRLAGAVAANCLRIQTRPAITIQVGTAITVNLISAEGTFLGGAIAPGIGIAAKALGEFTDLLPHLPLDHLSEPANALGVDTPSAIQSGLFWGTVGAIRELVAQLSEPLESDPDLFMTGGAAPELANLVSPTTVYVEHLVLSGIALAN